MTEVGALSVAGWVWSGHGRHATVPGSLLPAADLLLAGLAAAVGATLTGGHGLHRSGQR